MNAFIFNGLLCLSPSISLDLPQFYTIFEYLCIIHCHYAPALLLVGQTGPEESRAEAARGLQGGPPAACKPPLLP